MENIKNIVCPVGAGVLVGMVVLAVMVVASRMVRWRWGQLKGKESLLEKNGQGLGQQRPLFACKLKSVFVHFPAIGARTAQDGRLKRRTPNDATQ